MSLQERIIELEKNKDMNYVKSLLNGKDWKEEYSSPSFKRDWVNRINYEIDRIK